VIWRWILKQTVLRVHDEQLAEHGGGGGIRDVGLLESALARPENLAAYGKPDVAELAAAYATGVIKNHPFVDGNKRTGYIAAELFLALNGYSLGADDVDATVTTLRLAASEITEAKFADWIRANLAPLTDD
jgi:death on curing protein